MLTIVVEDTLDHTYPYGKQKDKRGGMWYTPVSGIWQTVWLEEVPQVFVKNIRVQLIDFDKQIMKFHVELNNSAADPALKITIRDQEFRLRRSKDQYSIEIDLMSQFGKLQPWSPETPSLYDFQVQTDVDTVSSYFALRNIDIREISFGENDKQRMICLNGRPYFFNGLLD